MCQPIHLSQQNADRRKWLPSFLYPLLSIAGPVPPPMLYVAKATFYELPKQYDHQV